MKLEINVGDTDRMIRIALGVVLALLALFGTIGAWGYLLAIIAIATGVTRSCVAYKLLGMSTANRA
jgi:uncharacterized membrane protein